MRRLTVPTIALLLVGCGGSSTGANVPPLAVNQSGVAERMARMAPAPEEEGNLARNDSTASKQGEPKEGESTKQSGDAVDSPPAVERDHPGKPEPTSSGSRVAFRLAPATGATGRPSVPQPTDDVRPDRDPRRLEFERRHGERLRQVSEE